MPIKINTGGSVEFVYTEGEATPLTPNEKAAIRKAYKEANKRLAEQNKLLKEQNEILAYKKMPLFKKLKLKLREVLK